MTNLIFAFMQSHIGDERETLLARYLRKFGGKRTYHSLWLAASHAGPRCCQPVI